MAVNHPSRDQITLENFFAALANPMRLQVVRALADGAEYPCGSLLENVSKSTLTHHWRVLREGGLIWQRPSGRELLLSLRREDLQARFPGLLDAVLAGIEAAEESAVTAPPAP
ncbi:helix-turn-helix domain-containing protein [Streptomyces alkaliphilus]|uniref:Helix-turn-helix domain-containing protein n=1 Tax=Streptomyces alkaliphilus TaxID=1472722 RepID=A0A7W3TAA3_9ACTN|nr:helix-turn-helix transcriptional regulator [Streptomyces alkaliphilus]MBB0242960.1 helix-turn-helix domain-containing protein [Streptomyces alkaliphilus]